VSSAAVQIVAIAMVVVHLRAPLRVSVALLITATFLIPGTALFPAAPAYMFVVRVGLWSAAAGMLVRAGTREIEANALRPSRVLVAVAIFVAIAYVFGVAFGPFPSQSEPSFELWLRLVDQLLFLWVATAAVRVLGVRFVAVTVASAVTVAAGIAVLERVTGGSYAHWWFRHQTTFAAAGEPLESRGGKLRVRAAGEYSLQFAWVLAYFAPLVGLLALRARRRIAIVAPAVVVLAIVLTVTRSVFAGLALGAVCVLIFARGDRRIVGAIALAALSAGVVYAGVSSVRHPYQAADAESRSVRTRRLNLLTNELTSRPWFGLGLDGPAERGITSTDSAVLGTYAALGVVGVAALVGAVAAAALTATSGGVMADAAAAPRAGAGPGGIASGVLGMFAFDSLTGPLASWSFWLLAALGVGLYEEAAAARGDLRPRRIRLPARRLLFLPGIGLALGVAVVFATPTHTSAQYRFFVLSAKYLTKYDASHADFVGRVIVQSTCDVAENALRPGVKVDCFDPLQLGPGTGLIRLETSSRQQLAVASAELQRIATSVQPTTRLAVSQLPDEARPTWARTAPVAGMVLGVEAALLLPAWRRRRRSVGQ
jgi:hypothetical protein